MSAAVKLYEEASTLGLGPGEWPQFVELQGRLFRRWHTNQDSDGDITTVVYRSPDGSELEVCND